MTVLDKFLILFESDADDAAKDTKKLDKSLKDTEKSSKKVIQTSEGVNKQFVAMGVKALGAIGGIVALTSAVTGLISTAQRIDELGKFADLIGENIEAVDAWGGAVVRAGGNVDGFRQSISSLNEKLIDAKVKGQNEITPFFNQLGISIVDSNNRVKSTLEILPELADAFTRIGKQKALGIGRKLGLDLGTIMLLQAGRTEIDKLIERQRKLGLVNREAARLSAEFNDIMADFKQITGFAAQNLLISFVPAVTWTIDKLIDLSIWARDNKPIVIGFFIGITAVAIPALISLASAGWAAIAPFLVMAAPFIAIAAAAGAAGVAISLVVEDIMAFVNGHDSLLGKMVEKWPILGDVIQFIIADIKQFIEMVKMLWVILTDFGEFLINIFIAPEKALKTMIDTLNIFKGTLDKISGKALEKLSSVFGGIKSFLGFGDDEVTLQKNISMGQEALALASTNPIASQTTNSITNSLKTSNRTTSVQTGDINIQTQAIDPDSIAAGISGSLQEEMRTTVENFDDGIAI